MKISFDPAKRAVTLAARGLDFADALQVFAGVQVMLVDDRQDYGEVRYQTFGLLTGRLVQLVWTWRDDARHIISMRKCNEREQARFAGKLG